MTLITVITVVYNGEIEIEQTIMSVLQQTFKDFEFIIIDGSSTDTTLQVIEKFKEDIDIIVSEPDEGIYDAMNKGIDMASGKWLYFLNCGDYLLDDFVFTGVSADLENCGNNINIYKVNVVDKNEEVIGKFPKSIKYSSYRDLFYTSLSHQAVFAKREDYIKVGKFDLNFKVYSDFYTIAKMLKSGITSKNYTRVITSYNNLGVSNNWKNVISLSIEREIILSLLDENFSVFLFIVAVLKSYFYYLRKYLQP